MRKGWYERGKIMRGNEWAWRMKHAVRFSLFLPFGATILEPNLDFDVWKKQHKQAIGRRRRKEREKERKKILISQSC